jgi:hypothetical protein
VAKGVTLTIQAGANVNFGSYYLQVNGTLIAKGTSTNQIKFSSGSITYTSYATPYNPQMGSGCIIENVEVSQTAITSAVAIKINQCIINAGLSVTGDSIVSNNNVVGNVNGGYLTNNSITGSVGSQTITCNNITGTVTGQNISNNRITGSVSGGYISNNVIMGAASGYGSGGLVFGSSYLGSLSYPVAENNLIINCQVGVTIQVLVRSWFGSSIPTIKNNVIAGNQVGITYDESIQEQWSVNKTVIQNNNISQNIVGIKLGLNSLCIIVNNNIAQNTNNSVYMQTSGDINLPNNYWGTTEQQAISKSIYDYNEDFNLGRVNYTPYSQVAYPVGLTPSASTVFTQTNTPTPQPPTPTPQPTNQQSTPNQTTEQTPHDTTPTSSPTDIQATSTPKPTIPETSLAVIILVMLLVAFASILCYRRKFYL